MTPIDWNENDRVVLQRRIEKLEREIREAADGRGARWRRRIEARLDAIVATFEPPLSDARDRIAALEQAHAETRDKCTDRFIQNRNRLYALERSVAPEEASGEGSFGIELEMWQSWSDRERLRAWDSQKQRAERAERELAEARAENDHLRKSIRNSDRDHWFHRAADLQDEIDAARDDATRLRAWALDRGHKPSCDGALPSYNCTCGLRVALDGAAT